ncbi:hypothetical protein B0H34DRAFT_708817 [Crassisporium funariophilum]|nr:hypothetical protein B0H34DRAFT_708817 [Crassisporium funariophilum]
MSIGGYLYILYTKYVPLIVIILWQVFVRLLVDEAYQDHRIRLRLLLYTPVLGLGTTWLGESDIPLHMLLVSRLQKHSSKVNCSHWYGYCGCCKKRISMTNGSVKCQAVHWFSTMSDPVWSGTSRADRCQVGDVFTARRKY